MNQSPVTQPTLIEADTSIHLLPVSTGRCDRCCTQMPIHSLRFVGATGGVPLGLRCVNHSACTDRERKMMAHRDQMAREWNIGGAA